MTGGLKAVFRESRMEIVNASREGLRTGSVGI